MAILQDEIGYCPSLLAGFISENIAKGAKQITEKVGGGGGGGGGGGLNSPRRFVLLVGSGFEISMGGNHFQWGDWEQSGSPRHNCEAVCGLLSSMQDLCPPMPP